MPYTPRKSDILFEKLEPWLQECIAAYISPEETFQMLHDAWQYEIDHLQKDIKKSYQRMYLKYRDAEFKNRREPTPDTPKIGKPIYEPLIIPMGIVCPLCRPCSGKGICVCKCHSKKAE